MVNLGLRSGASPIYTPAYLAGMHVFSLYLTTLPFGYWLVARYYPDGPLSWGELFALFLLILTWPLTFLVMILVKLDRE
jgi:hypothetical protein